MALSIAWGFLGGIGVWCVAVIILDTYRRSRTMPPRRNPPSHLRLIPPPSDLVDWSKDSEWA